MRERWVRIGELGESTVTATPVTGLGYTVITTTAPPLGSSGTDHERDGRFPLRPGALVGRYLVIEPIGAGGMGMVYRAFDPELDRSVALKVLPPRAREPERRRRQQARLLREGRALARLSHPNVVAVHDVGTFGEDVFVAMELVAGHSLEEFIYHHREPPPRRILEIYLAVGRGLAAAHAVGLVHRDVKPANIAIGADGAPRVLDFGLARAVEAPDSADQPAGSPTPPLAGAAQLTRDGSVVGTPRYMAPEQLRGEAVDARADQFSFCASLYEGLYRRPPFASRDRDRPPPELVIPARPRLPARVRRALARGLAADPADRYPAMDGLLADLARPVARRLWLAAVAALAIGLAAALVLRGGAGDQAEAECRRATAPLARVWGPAQRASIQTALGDPVVLALDRHAASWTAMRVEACEATHLRAEQSAELLEQRVRCLDRRLGRFAALVGELARTDAPAPAVDGDRVAAALDPLDACADRAALGRSSVGTGDAARLRHLDQVAALALTGRMAEADVRTAHLVIAADVLADPALLAEAFFWRGAVDGSLGRREAAERALRRAFRVAGQAGDDALMARSAIRLIEVIGADPERSAEVDSLSDFATSSVIRAGRDDLAAALGAALGAVHRQPDTKRAQVRD